MALLRYGIIDDGCGTIFVGTIKIIHRCICSVFKQVVCNRIESMGTDGRLGRRFSVRQGRPGRGGPRRRLMPNYSVHKIHKKHKIHQPHQREKSHPFVCFVDSKGSAAGEDAPDVAVIRVVGDEPSVAERVGWEVVVRRLERDVEVVVGPAGGGFRRLDEHLDSGSELGAGEVPGLGGA